MGNKKIKKAKKQSSRARIRKQNVIHDTEEVKEVKICECKLQPIEDTRDIISSKSLQNLIDFICAHSKTCLSASSIPISSITTKFLKLHCTGCCKDFKIRKDSPRHQLPLSDALVIGSYHAGIGYTSVKLLFACLEMPMIARETYQEAEKRMEKLLVKVSSDEMKANGEKEKQLAIENGDVIKIGDTSYPFVSVTVDAGWAKRSYGHSYNSNAGIGVIIGTRTRKILFMDSRIKSCVICDKTEKEDSANESTTTHHCYKNWEDSSQAMERDIIVKGFQKSLEDHGLIYKYLIGDADSSVFARIQAEVVYPGRINVEKIDCINHAVRGLNSKLYSLVKNTAYPSQDRDLVLKHINRFGKDVRAAVNYNHKNLNSTDETQRTSPKSLSEDIINIVSHIYDHHDNCKSYFCKQKTSTSDLYASFSKTAICKELNLAMHRLANRAHRIIHNTTSNFAECFMSVMTKCISGKRINYAQRGGYFRRSIASVMAYDYGTFWTPYLIPPTPTKSTPSLWIATGKFFEHAKGRGKDEKPKKSPFEKLCKGNTSKKIMADKKSIEYGPQALQGRFSDNELELAVSNLIQSLQVTPEQQIELEQSTIGQCFNDVWKFERRNRLTASNAGKVFRMKDWTKNACTLKSILYPMDLSRNENISNGINLEPIAKSLYTFLTGVDVRECGLFVSLENGILAASPDGLLGEDGIIEIKCITCTPEDVPKRKDKFLIYTSDTDKTLKINKSHRYYYQIIMQIHITGRSYCDFFVYHQPQEAGSEDICYCHTERIHKNAETEQLWTEMRTQFEKFYEQDMAPEIVDPIFISTKTFRTPSYRQEAIIAHEAKKKVPKKDTKKCSKNATQKTFKKAKTDATSQSRLIESESNSIITDEPLLDELSQLSISA